MKEILVNLPLKRNQSIPDNENEEEVEDNKNEK